MKTNHFIPHTPPSSQKKRDEREKRRMRAAQLFTQGITQAEVARRLQVTRTAVHYWHTTWERRGKEGLAVVPTGRRSYLTALQWQKVERKLLNGPQSAGYATDVWTLGRIRKLIHDTLNIRYRTDGGAWKLLARMRWSCQKPERRSKERDEPAIRQWIQHEWPAIQKRG